MALLVDALGAYAKQDEPYILTLSDAGRLHEAMRAGNADSASQYLDANPAGGPYGDKYLVMIPYGQAPVAGSAAGGPFKIVRARGSVAAAASQGQYVLGSGWKWVVSPTPALEKAAPGVSKYLAPIAIGAVALGLIYVATRRK